MHPLQELFATSEGERGFDDRLHTLFEARDFDAAEALLAGELATMEGEIAQLCRELPRDAAVLGGWEHLVEAIELHEGDPITGITLALANDPTLVFEKGRMQEPFVTLGLYTDEAFAFSSATPNELIAESESPKGPAWQGHEEDVELYLEAGGFGPLNTALELHDQRHFFRDADRAPAPMAYIDYVIGCWWRALRFQQAVAAEHAQLGALGGVPVVASTAEMRPELACVHLFAARALPARRTAGTDTTAEMRPELASLRMSAAPSPRRSGALDMTVEMRPLLAGLDLTGTSEAPATPRPGALELSAEVAPAVVDLDASHAPEGPAAARDEAPDSAVEIESVPANLDTSAAPEAPATPDEALDLRAEVEPLPVDLDTSAAPEAPAAADEPLDLTTEVEPVPANPDEAPAASAEPEPSALDLTVEVETEPSSLETPSLPEAAALDLAVEIESELADARAPDAEEAPVAFDVEAADVAELAPAEAAPRKPREEKAPTGTGLRRRLAEAEPAEAPERRSFLRRLFGRAQSYDEAA